MRGKGINYDTGAYPAGRATRPSFDAETVRRDMRVIADELHCTAVRVTGGDPERLSVAARHAAEAGLEVWFAPFLCELTTAEMLPVFADCARRAEEVRGTGAEVVFATGAELSIFARGFLPGDDLFARVALFTSGRPDLRAILGAVPAPLNAFLTEATATARDTFGGPVTYASVPYERIDWSRFDYVGADAYRAAHNAGHYREEIRGLHRHGKPVAVTEFGCCTFRGAADLGARGWLTADGHPRDEQEQVRYLREVLRVLEDEGVDSAFWFTFACYQFPRELDVASYGVVKIVEDGRWEPKSSFGALGEAYGNG